MKSLAPERIICLTEETVDLLYQLGEEERIVGISGFCHRPARAKKEKPVISTFTDGDVQAIMDLKPDLVLGFSDIQAGLASQLIEQGLTVWILNHRSVQGIRQMIHQIGGLVEQAQKARLILEQIDQEIEVISQRVSSWNYRPQVYFEEWYEPLITGIQWVSEIIELAGGRDIFPELRYHSLARQRIIADPGEVVHRQPDLILASWCGKKFRPQKMRERPGWAGLQAFQNEQFFEIPSDIILQPGPAALQEGLPLIHKYLQGVPGPKSA